MYPGILYREFQLIFHSIRVHHGIQVLTLKGCARTKQMRGWEFIQDGLIFAWVLYNKANSTILTNKYDYQQRIIPGSCI